MFAVSDTEFGLMLRHKRELHNFASEAQAVVDRQDREIVRLRKQLSASLTDNENLRREKGQRALAELAAIRALKKRRAN